MKTDADQKRRDLAKIHIARKELAMDEDAYRLMLESVAGVTSSAKLSARGRAKVLHRLRQLGWKPKTSARPRRRVTAQEPQDRKIRALWLDLAQMGVVRDRSEQALARYVKRQTGVEALDWLDGRQAEKVIEALKAWRKRFTDAQGDTDEPA